MALLNALNGTFVKERESLPFKDGGKDHGEKEISNLYMDNQRLIVALKNGMISIWNPETGVLMQTLDRTKDDYPVDDYPVIDKMLVRQNILVLTSERCIQFWEMVSGKMIGKRIIPNYIMDARLDLEGNRAALLCRLKNRDENDKIKPCDGDILIWQTKTVVSAKNFA